MQRCAKLLLLKKATNTYSLYACSLGFLMQSPSVLGLCVIALVISGATSVISHAS